MPAAAAPGGKGQTHAAVAQIQATPALREARASDTGGGDGVVAVQRLARPICGGGAAAGQPGLRVSGGAPSPSGMKPAYCLNDGGVASPGRSSTRNDAAVGGAAAAAASAARQAHRTAASIAGGTGRAGSCRCQQGERHRARGPRSK